MLNSCRFLLFLFMFHAMINAQVLRRLQIIDGIPGIGFATVVANAGDLDRDGCDELIVGTPFRSTALGSNTGQARVYSCRTGILMFSIDGPQSSAKFGRSVSAAGDANGDGVGDLVVGEPCFDTSIPTHIDAGRVYLLSGVSGAILEVRNGDEANQEHGRVVTGGGDVNGDGIPDFGGGSIGGFARIYSGANGAALRMHGTFVGGPQGLGRTLQILDDINGDGCADYALGFPFSDIGSTDSGRVAIFSGLDQSLIDRVLTRLADDRLRYEPAFQELRSWTLAEAHEAYADLAYERSEDPQIRRAVADARRRLGRIASEQGKLRDAEEALKSALEAARAIEKTEGLDSKLGYLQGHCLLDLFHVYVLQERSDEILATSDDRVAIWEHMEAAFPESVSVQAELARALRDGAAQDALAQNLDRARDGHQRSRATWESVVLRDPRPDHRRALVVVIAQLALMKDRLGTEGEGLPEFQRAIAVLEETRAESGPDYAWDRELASCYPMAAGAYLTRDDLALADLYDVKAVDLDRQILATVPNDVSTRHVLALGKIAVGRVRNRLDRFEDAKPYSRAIIENHRKLVETLPNHLGHAVMFGVAQKVFGSALIDHGREPEGVEFVLGALTCLKALPRDHLESHARLVVDRRPTT
ncbi:MAG: FG-GAP repeat protein [Planctomycetes bacterium]|nr:FG-GAP repeat protein [Planctomycetota bacterium]